ncbi:glycoside hydrolase family 13 protein [Lachnoclostridium sp. An181]|uniref:glycoside hydrolase family 13 protein n=1 Tax=Lachnoclostridium sp. An181 TaxID=1965575 RepID=UPI000B395CD8|nr:alpha-glucosidase [Lachnoclostridium sp. An181]OUP49085.1 glucohydrolase [Lachnoclostridium sp. An181]
MEKTWWKESVVYQIYPRSFNDSNGDGIGDLNGITEKLDYLKELGIDVIWLSPVYQSPNDDNGYDISDYKAIMKDFGTMEDYERMLAAAHERGIRIVMDLVVNHTSDEHAWFVESRKSADNPYRDYYIWREGKDGQAPNNWGSCFGGPAWEYDSRTQMYYLHLFSKKQPDLNWDNEKVREDVFEMMDWWCQKGIDGFRMDVISMISKTPGLPDGKVGENGYGDFGPYVHNGPHVHEYLQEMNQKVLSKYDLLTVGECAGVTIEEAKKYANLDGRELNMVFQFEHMDLDGGESFKWNDRKIDLVELKKTLSKWQYELYGKAWNSLYWCNHDQPRMISRLGDTSTKELREASAKMLGTCLHMMQGTPYVYQGEELGMTNTTFESLEDFRDIESINAYHQYTQNGQIAPEDMMRYLCYKSRDNARTPMQWDDSGNAGFTDGVPWIKVNPNYKEINAKEQMGRADSVFHYYQKLIRLRKEHEIIVYGKYQLLMEEDKNLYVYTRTLGQERMLVICNFRKETQEFTMPEGFEPGKGEILIGNYEGQEIKKSMTLRPFEAMAMKF